jgi:hypothetical protein
VTTWGEDRLPAEEQLPDPVHHTLLPAGQLLCRHDDAPPARYRQITEWTRRREVELPADPVEPPDWIDAETWARIRHTEPHTSAFWTVTLACGHATEVPTDLDWQPSDGPRRTTSTRQRQMTKEFEEFWANHPDEQNANGQDTQVREHTRRMLADRWPTPEPEQLCYRCPDARLIVAYQRVGWLVPRPPPPKPPKPPKPPSRAALQRQLRQAQAEVDRLCEQLAQLDTYKRPHGNDQTLRAQGGESPRY